MSEEDSQKLVFETAAKLFALLATPMRLRIIGAVCEHERNVSELLELIGTTQPNMSQHLATLHRNGILARRRNGAQIYYSLQNEKVAMLCRAVCTQVAIEMDDDTGVQPRERLMPLGQRKNG
jgi:DNA-binding transcriptional ArsR family regulator